MTFKYFDRNASEIENEGLSSVLTSLKTGTTTIRVMPAYSERGSWFRKVREYSFKIGEQWMFFPSPKDFNEPDPILEYCEEVYESGDMQEIEKIKRFRPSTRYLINAFILAEPNPMDRKDIVVLKVPKKVFMTLKSFDVDSAAGYEDITNPETGVNINIKREGQGLSTTYTVTPHRQASSIFDVLKERGLDLNSMTLHNLDEVYPPKSFGEMQEILATLQSDGEKVDLSEQKEEVKPNIQVEGGTPAPVVEDIKVEPPPKENK